MPYTALGERFTPVAKRGTWTPFSTTLIAGVIALALIAAPASLAYLQDTADSGAVTLTTGSATLALTQGSGETPAPYPGATFTANSTTPATVTNTGTVPLRLGATVTTSNAAPGSFGAALAFTVTAGGHAVWSGTPASGTQVPGPLLEPGETSTIGVTYAIADGTLQSALGNAASAFDITIYGTQAEGS